MNAWTPKTVLILAGVAVAGGLYMRYKAGETVKDVANAVNPVNHDNVFNQGFEGVYRWATGSQGTPGTDLYDWVHDDDRLWN